MDKLVKKIPAIIPARGGSKGLLNKNILILNGKPMIAWTIEAALKSEYISDVIISTDSMEIAEISKQFGGSIPFMRPDYLATDNALAIDAYLYTIENMGQSIEDFIILQPTSPLRNEKHIDEAIKLFYSKNADSVLSFYENPHPYNWNRTINDGGVLEPIDGSVVIQNRQDFKKTYLPNGAISILKYSQLKTFRTYYFSKTYPYLMDKRESIDIDDQFDFEFAEFIMKY